MSDEDSDIWLDRTIDFMRAATAEQVRDGKTIETLEWEPLILLLALRLLTRDRVADLLAEQPSSDSRMH